MALGDAGRRRDDRCRPSAKIRRGSCNVGIALGFALLPKCSARGRSFALALRPCPSGRPPRCPLPRLYRFGRLLALAVHPGQRTALRVAGRDRPRLPASRALARGRLGRALRGKVEARPRSPGSQGPGRTDLAFPARPPRQGHEVGQGGGEAERHGDLTAAPTPPRTLMSTTANFFAMRGASCRYGHHARRVVEVLAQLTP
jgi:hypothetical protein